MPTPTELNSSSIDKTNLKAYYRFSTGALTTDSSGAGHTLTDISDPAEVDGVFGKAADFDGNDAYSAVDHADFKPTGNFSIGFWMKTSTTGTTMGLFQSSSINPNRAGIFLTTNTLGSVVLYSGKNTGTTVDVDYKYVASTTEVTDNVVHFIVGTWDGTHLKLYIDGVQEGGDVDWTNAPAYAATNYVRIGCRNLTGSNGSYLTGFLDDVFLFNGKALTATEVASLWTHVGKVAGVTFGTMKSVSGVTRVTAKKIAGIA